MWISIASTLSPADVIGADRLFSPTFCQNRLAAFGSRFLLAIAHWCFSHFLYFYCGIAVLSSY